MTGDRAAARHRRMAAELIRCMDFRDQAGADAVLAKAVTLCAVDGVTGWVWRLEYLRAYPPDPAAAEHRAVLLAGLDAFRAEHRADRPSAARYGPVPAATRSLRPRARKGRPALGKPRRALIVLQEAHAEAQRHRVAGRHVPADVAELEREYWRVMKARRRPAPQRGVLQQAHAEAQRHRVAGRPVPGPLAALEREYWRVTKQAQVRAAWRREVPDVSAA